MADFIAIDASDLHPPGTCRQCAEQAVHHAPSDSTFVHCRHFRSGAMRVGNREWITAEDITARDFQRAAVLAMMVTELQYIARHTEGATQH